MGVKGVRAALFALALCAAIGAAAPPSRPPILVLVSFDGFRFDYADRYDTPNLRSLAARGVRAAELIPSFPVLTFPNHYTIVTGLYPAHHGVVANTMSDPATSVRFAMSNDAAVRDGFWWAGGEPLWVSAETQGRRAGAMFWPGTEADIHGVRPTYYRAFDGKLPAAARTAQVLEWLALPEGTRPSLVTLYYDDVDHAGHDHGPESTATRVAVAEVDRQLGALVAGIERLHLSDRVTVVVVSDHGMAPLSDSRSILLDDYLDPATFEVIEGTGFLALRPRGNATADGIYARLVDAHPRLRVFNASTMPPRLHYTGNPRIAPIVGIPDVGWTVGTTAARQRRHDEGREPQAGTHGFDPADRLMHGIFVAAGPGVRRGLIVEPLENVHLYNFLCAVLGVKPAPNDGDPARVSAWMRR